MIVRLPVRIGERVQCVTTIPPHMLDGAERLASVLADMSPADRAYTIAVLHRDVQTTARAGHIDTSVALSAFRAMLLREQEIASER